MGTIRTPRIWGTALGLAAALAAASFAWVAPASAATGGGIGLRPAHVEPNDPATRAYFKPTVAPGATFTDEVVVSNTGDAPVDLIVSGVDGLTGQTSGAVYANRQDPVRRAGAWLTPSSPTMTVPPHDTANMAFTVRVPADAAPGDHLAGIAFENAHPTTSGGSVSVTEVVRAVMGVQIQVPGPAEFHLHVDSVDLQASPGTGIASVLIRMGNDGGKLGKPALSVTVTGPNGYHRSVDRDVDSILPGDSIELPFAWPDSLPPGDYTVVATAKGGSSAPAKTEGTTHLTAALVGQADAVAPPAVATVPASHHSGPALTLLLIIVVAVAGVGGGLALGRRGKGSSRAPLLDHAASEPPPEEGALSDTGRRNR
jgi:hypothetical protein